MRPDPSVETAWDPYSLKKINREIAFRSVFECLLHAIPGESCNVCLEL